MEWKLALVQHPMYFIIKEDSLCAEREPPDGEPTIELYIARVAQNLAALRRYPSLKIGYEWSGLELELLAEDGPDVFREMCALAGEGRIAFYNGTYAQPHLQTLSAEANLRQFEFGMRVYRELCGGRLVQVYAHQEASVHDQVPQLLHAFGIRYAVVPEFCSTLGWLDEGELNLHMGTGPRFVQGHEFVGWRGLDGTEIPLYLRQHQNRRLEDFLSREAIAGRLRVPPILLTVPDLITVDDRWIESLQGAEVVLLDEALPERQRQCPARAHARFYSNWSYIEGIRAEELSRCNLRAETSALRAEALNALAFALVGRPVESTDSIWKTILATQHHDVYCFCAPELRSKSVAWLDEVAREAEAMTQSAAEAIVERVDCAAQTGRPVVLFGTVPHTQTALVTLEVPMADPQIVDAQGQTVPAEVLPAGDEASQLSFLANTGGLSYNSYWIRGGGSRAPEENVNGPLSFDNQYFRATVDRDGTFTSLRLPTGDELLDCSHSRGNELLAMDSTGLSPHHEGVDNSRPEWQAPPPGTELRWEATDEPSLRRSSLGVSLMTHGRIGDHVKTDLTLSFYHGLARIDLAWTFNFDLASIGTFYDDESKLRVRWPLAFAGEIYHDMAFGLVRTWEERQFHPLTWTDISDGKKGLAYFHQGTPKHWVSEGALVNLFAWGEKTNAIGSRFWRVNNPKSFDQRLTGSHTIRCALYPHVGDWRAAGVIGAARDYVAGPVAYLAMAHPGDLPASKTLLSFTDPDVVATAVRVEGQNILCRLYATGNGGASVAARMDGLQPVELRSLDGRRIERLSPFQIGGLILSKDL